MILRGSGFIAGFGTYSGHHFGLFNCFDICFVHIFFAVQKPIDITS